MKALVVGLGVSGLGAVAFLLQKGYAVVGFDEKIKDKGFEIVTDVKEIDWASLNLVVVSPGIASQHPVYQMARKKEIEILGEAGLAALYIRQKALAITGTNGKTTVTLLLTHVLNSCNIKAKALGNVGEALTSYLLNPNLSEVLVVELSSYQLETMHFPIFDAGIILNITPDHLDRYPSMEDYARAKCQLQCCIKSGGALYVGTQVAKDYGHLLQRPYRTYGSIEGSELSTNKEVANNLEKIEYFLPLRYRDRGMHESENALAVFAMCQGFGISGEQFSKALESFQNPAHRIEFVAEINGIVFYDDSKGTNLDAVIRAVAAMKGPVILIVGGVDKGASYLPWRDAFEGKVKKMIAIGLAAEKIYRELSAYFDIECVDSLSSAINMSVRDGVSGDHVLLSPGCSSFDMFSDYAHRGNEFQKYVKEKK